tara:strand:+ start:5498 stop:5929 length:432 start_codon:yes stop_codon:yes gene_type:complete
MSRFANSEQYLATPIQAFLPDSVDWGNYTTRMMQQRGFDEVNDANADYQRELGEWKALQLSRRGQQIASGITAQGNQALFDGAMSFGVGAAGSAGLFGGGGAGDFSVGDAEVMGMPTGQAEYMGGGGTTEWTTDMGQNAWTKY